MTNVRKNAPPLTEASTKQSSSRRAAITSLRSYGGGVTAIMAKDARERVQGV